MEVCGRDERGETSAKTVFCPFLIRFRPFFADGRIQSVRRIKALRVRAASRPSENGENGENGRLIPERVLERARLSRSVVDQDRLARSPMPRLKTEICRCVQRCCRTSND